MKKTFCAFILKQQIDLPVRSWTTTLEFLLAMTIAIFGILLNIKFSKKLEEERQNKPIGRKGNVIEPIMRWFIKLQLVYWPYELISQWMSHNGIIPIHLIRPWLCSFLLFTVMCGRCITAYNSLFLALIRYVYVVHFQKANLWDFEKVARRFQFASILIPFWIQVFWCFTFDWSFWIEYAGQVGAPLAQNTTDYIELTPIEVEFTLSYVPEPLVHTFGILTMILQALAYLNVIEAFLYAKIFQTIKR